MNSWFPNPQRSDDIKHLIDLGQHVRTAFYHRAIQPESRSYSPEFAELFEQAGTLLALEMPIDAMAGPPSTVDLLSGPPTWNAEERVLTFRGFTARSFAPSTGPDVMTILTAFEECKWAPRIDDPLPSPDADRTKQALRTINRKLKGLKFSKDGDGIKWGTVSP
ncbi:MAG: hypothetical protein R3C17_00375 [Planctomycetaceae bacterium]